MLFNAMQCGMLLLWCSPKGEAWQEGGKAACRPVTRQALAQAAEPVTPPTARNNKHALYIRRSSLGLAS
jgi:hypothetical protein